MDGLELEDLEPPRELPSIFFSLKVRRGHERAIGELFGKLIEFCDETGAGWIPVGPHRIPGHSSVVLTVQFTSEEQKQAFLRLPEYQHLRIELVNHCQKGGISVLK
jgi:hypothetical protein